MIARRQETASPSGTSSDGAHLPHRLRHPLAAPPRSRAQGTVASRLSHAVFGVCGRLGRMGADQACRAPASLDQREGGRCTALSGADRAARRLAGTAAGKRIVQRIRRAGSNARAAACAPAKSSFGRCRRVGLNREPTANEAGRFRVNSATEIFLGNGLCKRLRLQQNLGATSRARHRDEERIETLFCSSQFLLVATRGTAMKSGLI